MHFLFTLYAFYTPIVTKSVFMLSSDAKDSDDAKVFFITMGELR